MGGGTVERPSSGILLDSTPHVWLGETSIHVGTMRPQSTDVVNQFGMQPNDSAMVTFVGDIEPIRQHQILDINLIDSEGNQKQIARAFFNERGDDCGILIEECTQNSVVAFLHTGLAVSERLQPQSKERTVTIFGATSIGDDTVMPIAIVCLDDENQRARPKVPGHPAPKSLLWRGIAHNVNDPPTDSSGSVTSANGLPASKGMGAPRTSMGANPLGPPLFEALLDAEGHPSTLRYMDGRVLATSLSSTTRVMQVSAAEDLWHAVVGVIASRKLA